MAKNDLKEKKLDKKMDEKSMDRLRIVAASLLAILVLVGAYFGYKEKNKELEAPKNSYVATESEKKFKEEYESLNGTVRQSTKVANKTVNIVEDNNVEYIDIDQAADILEKGSGLIYFGFASCPWCRTAVPVLLNAMESTNLEKIYYVDVRPNDDANADIRARYTLVKNQPKLLKEASSPRYDDVLNSLSEFLSEYTLTADTGKTIPVGKKNLSAPTVVVVQNGVVLDVHIGTINGHVKDEEGVLRDLTSEEEGQLNQRYVEMINKLLKDSCSTDSGC